MAPLEEAPPEQDPASALQSAGQSLGFCLLTFPISTLAAALLIGLQDSLPQMTSPSPAPLWICLGICALFFAGAVLSLRSARRSLAGAGMPPYELQRQISAMWIVTAALMLAAGLYVLGNLAVYRGGAGLFGWVERPFPLAVTFILYVLAATLLLGRNWLEVRKAGRLSKLQEARNADWFRQRELYMAHSTGECVYGLVIATFMLALLIGARPRPEAGNLMIMGLFALGSWLCVLLVRRSRRHLEAAGLSQEEIRDQMASFWRSGAFMMIVIGAGGLACVIFAFDVLTPADRPWALGSALGYTLAGILLFWRNRRKRGTLPGWPFRPI